MEAKTRAKSERFIAVLDVKGFHFRKGPPFMAIRKVISILKSHYPYSIERLYLINTSQAFQLFFDFLKPFLSSKMMSKIAVVANRKELNSLIGLDGF